MNVKPKQRFNKARKAHLKPKSIQEIDGYSSENELAEIDRNKPGSGRPYIPPIISKGPSLIDSFAKQHQIEQMINKPDARKPLIPSAFSKEPSLIDSFAKQYRIEQKMNKPGCGMPFIPPAFPKGPSLIESFAKQHRIQQIMNKTIDELNTSDEEVDIPMEYLNKIPKFKTYKRRPLKFSLPMPNLDVKFVPKEMLAPMQPTLNQRIDWYVQQKVSENPLKPSQRGSVAKRKQRDAENRQIQIMAYRVEFITREMEMAKRTEQEMQEFAQILEERMLKSGTMTKEQVLNMRRLFEIKQN